MWADHSGETFQVVHEFDIMHTEGGEYYFVIALFGNEFVINYGGPELEGYRRWLSESNNASPLYSGKNASDRRLRLAPESQ